MSASAHPQVQAAGKNQILNAALVYAERGAKVLPCKPDKSPAIDGGFCSASGDAAQIRGWFSDVGPQLAIACEPSGLVVIDVDDVAAFNLYLHAMGLALPETYTVRSPSGGLHYYFKVAPGASYPGKLCPGVDIKWNGYVMAPPSQAFSKRAGVTGKYSVVAMKEIAPAPVWLAANRVAPSHARAWAAPRALTREQDLNYEELQELLRFINPDVAYEKWIAVLMAIHGATSGTDQGLCLAVSWSSGGAKFKPGEVEQKWSGFDRHKGLTIASLAAIAKEHGADLAAISRGANLRRQERMMKNRPAFDFAGLDLTNVIPMLYSLSCIGGTEVQDEAVPVRSSAQTATAPASHPRGEPHTALAQRVDQFRGALLSADMAKPLLAQRYLIKGLLLRSSVAMLYGPSGTGKTFYALHLAHCVASGQPFDGLKVRQGVVIYVSAEGTGSIGSRLTAIGPNRSGNLKVLPLAIDLHSDDLDLTAILTLAKETMERSGREVVLIVIDTLARSFGGGDENAAAEMNKVLSKITALKEALDTTVLIVHHTGKDTERGARGSSALRAGIETELEMKSKDGLVQVRATKQRDLDGDWSHCFEIVPVELGLDEDGDPVTSCRIRFVKAPSKGKMSMTVTGFAQKKVLALLSSYAAEHGTDGSVGTDDGTAPARMVDREAFRRLAVSTPADGSDNSLNKRNVNEAITSLVERGILGQADGMIWLKA